MNRTSLAIALVGAFASINAARAQDSHPDAYPVPNPKGAEATWTPTAEESYVKSVIHDAGFTAISDMMRGPDGTWHAHAMKGSSKVDVAVDRSGHVAAN